MGLSECSDLTSKDRSAYIDSFIRVMCSSSLLAKLVKLELLSDVSTSRHPFVSGFMRSVLKAEFDPNLIDTSQVGKLSKAAKTRRYNLLKLNEGLDAMYGLLFTEFGAVNFDESKPGIHSPAQTFEAWDG